jgi:hypothetical protein
MRINFKIAYMKTTSMIITTIMAMIAIKEENDEERFEFCKCYGNDMGSRGMNICEWHDHGIRSRD